MDAVLGRLGMQIISVVRVYTHYESYPAALLQERNVNFDGVNARQWWGYPNSRKNTPLFPIAGTITRADCIMDFYQSLNGNSGSEFQNSKWRLQYGDPKIRKIHEIGGFRRNSLLATFWNCWVRISYRNTNLLGFANFGHHIASAVLNCVILTKNSYSATWYRIS